MTSPYDLFFFTILGGVGTMFASFCWEMYDAFNTQRSKLWNYTLLFLSEQQRRLGSCFYALFFCLLEFLRSKGFIVKHRIVQPGQLRIINTD